MVRYLKLSEKGNAMSESEPTPLIFADTSQRPATQPSPEIVICEECGKHFEANVRRRYCSNLCNVRAFRRHQLTISHLERDVA